MLILELYTQRSSRSKKTAFSVARDVASTATHLYFFECIETFLSHPQPNRAEEEKISREEAAEWAMRWVGSDDPGDVDAAVWTALVQPSGTDLISTDRPYLHMREDFEEWLARLLRSDVYKAGP